MKLLQIDAFNLFSNPGFGASVLLGTAGSIYLILQSVKLVSKKNTQQRSITIGNQLCVICNAELKNSNEELSRCKDCNNTVCGNQKCSEYNLEIQKWMCINCKKNREIQQKTGEFFLQHLNELEDRSLAVLVESIINKWNEVGQEVAIVITKSQLNTVSKFVEVILEKKIESALAIERSCDQQHLSQTAANTTTSNDYHADLKRFITHVCEEVMKLSNTVDIAGIPPRSEIQQNDEQIILSTAVQQSELEQSIDIPMAIADKVEVKSASVFKVDDNQNHIPHSYANESKAEEHQSECEKCKEREQSTSTELEEINFHDDFDMQHLNDRIQSHSIALPDLSSESDFLNDDDFETPNDNWQLREILKSNQHGAITMLIPSMTQEMRAQIGDRSADEYDSDLSENEIEYEETGDEEFPQSMCYSTTVHIMTKTPLASIKTVTVPLDIDNNESFTSMIDIEPLSLEAQTKNDDKIEGEINFADISPPNVVSFDNVEDEELFDSIVEISSINDHKKSIDEAFESILKEDCSEILRKEEEIAQRVHETLENLLKEEEEATKRIHEAVNAAPLRDNRTFLPVENVHEAINGINESSAYKILELDVENRTRYTSPLFKDYNLAPIKSLKVTENNPAPPLAAPTVSDPVPSHVPNSSTKSQFQLPIPSDNSINNLLHTSSLISRSRSHIDLNNGVDDENLILKDPEKVLTNSLVPGSFSEREHFKWLHAAPIANNPYSPDILERRLSETQNKSKVIDIQALLHQHEQPIEENKNEEDETKPQRPNIIKYARDYYVNDEEAKLLLKNRSKSPLPKTSPTKHAMPIHFNESNEEIIKPRKKTYEEMTVSMLIEDVEVPVKYTRHDQDFSLTMSEDSETTRIYTPRTQQVSTFKGIPVSIDSMVSIDGTEVAIIDHFDKNQDEMSFEEAFEEKQVIEKDVLEQLPSVRKLAELYKQDTPEENTLKNNHVKPSAEKNVTKDFHQNYLAPIASITARTLPAQVRANLKQSFENEDSESYARYDDREPSPDIQPGFTRNSIAYFEKLGN